MKSLLFTLVFALCMSVTAIGITVPDRQTPNLVTMETSPIKVIVVGNQSAVVSMAIAAHVGVGKMAFVNSVNDIRSVGITSDIQGKTENLRERLFDKFVISSKFDAEYDDIIFTKDEFAIESLQENAVRRRFDSYQMPIYKYRPSIKPPLIRLHRSTC